MKKSKKTGFSLLEMIIAIGIFSVVLTITMTAFLSLSNIQKKTATLRSVTDSINLAMEIMSREIRTGYEYCVDTACTPTSFNFRSADSGNVIYYEKNGNRIWAVKGSAGFFLTQSNVIIDNLEFVVAGEGTGDNRQPMVTIIINASYDYGNITTELNLQTSVTQRKVDG